LRTLFDNQTSDQILNVVVGISNFDLQDDILKIQLRKNDQEVTINETSGGLDFTLGEDSWYGTDQTAATGADSAVLSVDPSELLSRIELIGNGTQETIVDSPEEWAMGATLFDGDRFLRSIVKTSGAQQQIFIDMPSPWQNVVNRYDTNNDRATTVLDALNIINELSRGSFIDLATNQLKSPSELSEWPGTYYDANGDDRGTVLDALIVINQIARTTNSSGEGELADVAIQEWIRDLTPISKTNQESNPIEMNAKLWTQQAKFAHQTGNHLVSPAMYDAQYKSLGDESLKTLDESLLSLLDETE
ncbi:MAG: dockerin type I domain-containing protein, partial [Rubripirellula sp.]